MLVYQRVSHILWGYGHGMRNIQAFQPDAMGISIFRQTQTIDDNLCVGKREPNPYSFLSILFFSLCSNYGTVKERPSNSTVFEQLFSAGSLNDYSPVITRW